MSQNLRLKNYQVSNLGNAVKNIKNNLNRRGEENASKLRTLVKPKLYLYIHYVIVLFNENNLCSYKFTFFIWL